MVETGDGKKDSEAGFSSLNEVFATYEENNPDSCPPLSVFELPDVSSPGDSQELTVVEKMHLESHILGWGEHEHRKNAADALIGLAEDVDTSFPTICRIRDILSFHNKRLGGKELASYVRKAKKLVEKNVQRDVFNKKKTLSYPPSPGRISQPPLCQEDRAKAPIKK